jgi:hypothetical protein
MDVINNGNPGANGEAATFPGQAGQGGSDGGAATAINSGSTDTTDSAEATGGLGLVDKLPRQVLFCRRGLMV